MSREAVEYVRGLGLPAGPRVRVFMVLALLASGRQPRTGMPDLMGLVVRDGDIAGLAGVAEVTEAGFREELGLLPARVRELTGGRTEIVFGPGCDSGPPGPDREAEMAGRKGFAMPGWEDYSVWGYEEGAGFWAQLWRNADDPDAGPRIWITPARGPVTSVSGLARAIARELAACEAVPPPAAVVRTWLLG